MPLKKVVLFIVEGETDELALGASLNRLFAADASSEVKFEIFRGDLITNRDNGRGCAPNDVKTRVRDQARQYLAKQKYKWSDLDTVVYLTDTDGAFVDASSVVENDKLRHVVYYLDRIETPHAASIVARNDNKAACLKILSRNGYLTFSKQRVKFMACYMSRNLEHALSDYSGEATPSQKQDLSRAFSAKFRRDPHGFSEFINCIAPEGSYSDSWDFIAQDIHSLERGSNLSQVVGRLKGEPYRD